VKAGKSGNLVQELLAKWRVSMEKSLDVVELKLRQLRDGLDTCLDQGSRFGRANSVDLEEIHVIAFPHPRLDASKDIKGSDDSGTVQLLTQDIDQATQHLIQHSVETASLRVESFSSCCR